MADPNSDLPSDEELDAILNQIDAETAQAKSKAQTAPTKAELKQAADDILKAAGPADDPDTPEALKARIIELETEAANTKDQALRAMAEAQNVKKRAEREVKNARDFGIERFANDILSVHDNLSRALISVDDKTKGELGENAKTLLEGIELTEKNLMAVLARHGVKAVPGKGSKFDPNVHQAVANYPADEEKGHVAEVMQTGFTIGERTLRAAMVAVSTGKA